MVVDVEKSEALKKLFLTGKASLTKEEEEYYGMWRFQHETGIRIWEFAELLHKVQQRTSEQNQEIVDKLQVLCDEGWKLHRERLEGTKIRPL